MQLRTNEYEMLAQLYCASASANCWYCWLAESSRLSSVEALYTWTEYGSTEQNAVGGRNAQPATAGDN